MRGPRPAAACALPVPAVVLLAAAVPAAGPGCAGVAAPGGGESRPEIRLTRAPDPGPGGARGTGGGAVDVRGLPAADLAAVRAARFTRSEWEVLLRVTVAGGGTAADAPDLPAVLGDYAVTDDAVRFSPRYPFDPGRRYRVVFSPQRLPARPPADGGGAAAPWRERPLEAVVGEPAARRAPSTRVVRVYPTADVVPENQLRFYVHFSAPMGLEGGSDHVRLIDAEGQVVDDAFLPLDLALWNAGRTRCTLLFDPGRVKRGILPNVRRGRPLAEGRRFTLAVDSAWRDADGLPLAEPFRRSFTAGPPEERALDLADWRLRPPAAGGRDPLVVVFDRPLDHALLRRALLVASPAGGSVPGDVDVRAAETEWAFTPHAPWERGEHRLTALPALEDTAGNRVGRPFEVGASPAAAGPDPAAPMQRPFRPAAPAPAPVAGAARP